MKTKLSKNQKGAAAAMFAIMLPVFIAGLGLAIDAGATFEQNRRMQTAADAAALAAAQEVRVQNTGSYESAALDGALSNGFERDSATGIEVRNPPTTGAYKGDGEYVEVIVSQPQPLFFMNLFKDSPDTIRARAVAGMEPSDICLLVKNKTASSAFSATGNATLRLDDCGIMVNSSHSKAASSTGSAVVEASTINVVGGTNGSNFEPDPYTGAEEMADPFENFVMPPFGACTYTSKQIVMTSTTLSPGVYCGGIELRSQAKVTFLPGTYYLVGGGLNANAGASISGAGVTFVNTEKKPTYTYDRIWINGGAAITLSPPTSGTWKGILFYQDPKISSTKQNVFAGGAEMSLTGIVYFPTTSTKFSGDFASDGNKIFLVSDKVEITGNTTFSAVPTDYLPRTLLAARVVE
ncbi:MAG: pilus assembly protein TadG-related protein [Armatimonadota bacterium]